MKKTGIFFILSLSFSFFLIPVILADTIYLKNKRTMEGIITSEDDRRVVLNVGVGTVTLEKDSIERIERDQGNTVVRRKWAEKYSTHVDFAPFRLKDIAREFRELECLRKEAVQEKAVSRAAEKTVQEKQDELNSLYKDYMATNERLSRADSRKDPVSYNRLVAEHNVLASRIKIAEQEKETARNSRDVSGGAVSAYRAALAAFRAMVKARGKELGDNAAGGERAFLEGMEERTGEMTGDFDRHRIPIRKRGAGMLVDVILNQKVPATMVIDTGATMVLLSGDLARRLGVRKDGDDAFSVTLANGEKVKAYPVVLERIDVSGAGAENVQAAVLERDFPGTDDGLLGMSFLEHFSVKIDSKTNNLILEDFSP